MSEVRSICDEAYTVLSKIYGSNVPKSFNDRFNIECKIFDENDSWDYLALGQKLSQMASSQDYMAVPRGNLASSLIAWLLGITHVNPLPPHEYCPKCHKLFIRTDVKDEWDLPRTTCHCGTVMRRDGHDIPSYQVKNILKYTMAMSLLLK